MKKIFLLILVVTTIFLCSCSSQRYEDGYAAGYDAGFQAAITYLNTTSSEVTEPEKTTSNNLTVQPEPKNGYVFEEITGWECVAPLTIETAGEGGYYFVIDPIKFPASREGDFVDYRAELLAKHSYMRFYADAGSSVTINVPLGEYEIYYAHGTSWYGEEHLFGPDTTYFKCDDTFLFEEASNGYNGWTISLTPVANGNLDTDLIGENGFPK